MKKLFVILTYFISSILFSQQENKIEDIINSFEQNPNIKVSIKAFDLDNDNDLDYIFDFNCGEANCLKVYLNIDGNYKIVIDEFGRPSFNLTASEVLKSSSIMLKSKTSHCCGESPFNSFREFIFKKDKVIIKNNYVQYDHKSYNDETIYLQIEPEFFIKNPYQISIQNDSYNLRFSADLKTHNSTFTCPEKSNIIAKLKKNSTVTVIGEFRGNDYETRTWLYIEALDNTIYDTYDCQDAITYGFKDQKLRGWISNRFIKKQ